VGQVVDGWGVGFKFFCFPRGGSLTGRLACEPGERLTRLVDFSRFRNEGCGSVRLNSIDIGGISGSGGWTGCIGRGLNHGWNGIL